MVLKHPWYISQSCIYYYLVMYVPWYVNLSVPKGAFCILIVLQLELN